MNYLRSKGLAKGGDLSNCIVLDESGILNMALLGMPLLGTYVSFAGSHKLNHLLTKQLLSDEKAYEIVSLEDRVEEESLEYAYETH